MGFVLHIPLFCGILTHRIRETDYREDTMQGMTIEHAARACKGRICGDANLQTELRFAVIDSRKVGPGDLFIAYRGERVDGHDYIAAAFERGAACCLAERIPEGETRPVLLVPDVQRALEQIAEEYRKSLNLPVIGITGSVGKTSAKEMIAAVLAQRFRVLKTEGNLNNQIGVPMTISQISSEHEVSVIEMGISGFGEMHLLSRIVRPTIGVFTVIGHAHLEFLQDLDGVLRAKTEMLDEMSPDAVIVVNGDDEKLRSLACAQKKITVGLGPDCDLRADDIILGQGETSFTLVCEGERVPVRIPAFGQHMVYAALEGAAVGHLLGMSWTEISAGVANYAVVGRRGAVTETGYLTLIDDSYNANPDSIRSSIDTLKKMPGRHVCVLGDMLELGKNSPELHWEVGCYAAKQGMDAIYVAGAFAKDLCDGAGEIAQSFENKEALIQALPELLQRGDAVLVQASRGMHFEDVAEALKQL